jgi:hypothetical protein
MGTLLGMSSYGRVHSVIEYDESEFSREFLRSYLKSKKRPKGTFTYRNEYYCWGSFREYGPPPIDALVIELSQEGFEPEEFRVWYGIEETGAIRRARHVKFDDLPSIKEVYAL